MKTILITGANRGLGLGFTGHYLDLGWRVYACARDWQQCAERDAFTAGHGDRFLPLELDVTNEQAVAALPAALGEGRPDVVLNNAGTLQDEPLGRWSAATFETAMAVNCIAPALIAQALLSRLDSGARIVNISSGLASNGLCINPETGLDAYSASKAALNMVTRRLAAKLPDGVTVAAIDPGWVQTRMGGPDAELTVAESIRDVAGTIDRLGPEQNGLFLSRTGEPLPW